MNAQLEAIIRAIRPVESEWIEKAKARQMELTKPPFSLGKLEEIANRLCAIQETLAPNVDAREILVFAASHGVCEENISPYPATVTAQMVLNFLHGGAAINALAKSAGAKLTVIDIGVDGGFNTKAENFIQEKIAPGTANFTIGPAMTEQETLKAISIGINLARKARENGVNLIGLGEMGIGNTTPASAISALLLGLDPEITTGRGTGATDDILKNKIAAIRRGIEVNRPNRDDAFDILQKVGGFEIAGLVGLVIGAARLRIAVVTDGFIATAAAALAVKACPAIADYIFAAHLSAEQGHRAVLGFINQDPILDLGMRLGEGSGAALAMNIISSAARYFCEMETFSGAGVSDKA